MAGSHSTPWPIGESAPASEEPLLKPSATSAGLSEMQRVAVAESLLQPSAMMLCSGHTDNSFFL